MSMRPVPEAFTVSQTYYGTFSTKVSGGTHHGAIDYACPVGTQVVAPDDGVIRHAGWCWNLPGGPNDWEARNYQIKADRGNTTQGGGNMITLENELKSQMIFAHLSDSSLVKVGQRVKKGQVIGLTGDTGVATGPHLHFSLIPANPDRGNGAYGAIDPQPYLTESYKRSGDSFFKPNPVPPKYRHGIDVSSHQPPNISRMVSADYVLVKMTEGAGPNGYVNPNAAEQIKSARAQGRPVGLYHFATAKFSSSEEAQFFLTKARPYLRSDVVPVLDWEPGELTSYTQWAEDWLREVDHHTASRSLIYMNLGASRLGTWTAFAKAHPLWLAYYGADQVFRGYATEFYPPSTPGWTLAMWQYSQRGVLPGYSGFLDLNVQFQDLDQWKQSTSNKDWLDMASKKEVQDALWEVLNRPIPRRGAGQKGSTTLVLEAAWNKQNFAQVFSLVAGVPGSLLRSTIDRKGSGKGTKVTPAEVYAYDKDNWSRNNADFKEIQRLLATSIHQQEQILSALSTDNKEENTNG